MVPTRRDIDLIQCEPRTRPPPQTSVYWGLRGLYRPSLRRNACTRRPRCLGGTVAVGQSVPGKRMDGPASTWGKLTGTSAVRFTLRFSARQASSGTYSANSSSGAGLIEPLDNPTRGASRVGLSTACPGGLVSGLHSQQSGWEV